MKKTPPERKEYPSHSPWNRLEGITSRDFFLNLFINLLLSFIQSRPTNLDIFFCTRSSLPIHFLTKYFLRKFYFFVLEREEREMQKEILYTKYLKLKIERKQLFNREKHFIIDSMLSGSDLGLSRPYEEENLPPYLKGYSPPMFHFSDILIF